MRSEFDKKKDKRKQVKMSLDYTFNRRTSMGMD